MDAKCTVNRERPERYRFMSNQVSGGRFHWRLLGENRHVTRAENRGRTIVRISLMISLLALGVSGCAMTLPVKGQATSGGETFTGKATGYLDGGGTIEITSNRGRLCTGTFVYVTNRNGSGTFACEDGNSGSFDFVSTGTRGTGTGTIGGQEFTFTFG